MSVLIDAFGYRAAHSILGQVSRLLTRQLDERDLLGRHSGNAFLILTQRPYAEIEALVRQIHERVFTLSIETTEGRVPEGRFGVAGMDPVASPEEAGPAVDALIINAEIALGSPAKLGKAVLEAPAAVAEAVEAVEPDTLAEPELPAEPEVPAEPEILAEPEAPVESEERPEPVMEVQTEPEPIALTGGNGANGPVEETVAPVEHAGSPRVVLARCDVSDAGMAATVEIEVRFGDRVAVGKVVGRNAPDRIPYLVGEATGRALTELLPTGFGVVLQEVRHVTQGENQALWTTVMLVSPEGEEKLLGIAPGADHGHTGPAKAVLNAVNRRLSLVLAQAS